jgi:hypothetical protein
VTQDNGKWWIGNSDIDPLEDSDEKDAPIWCRLFGHSPEMNWCRRCGKSLAPAKRNPGRWLRPRPIPPGEKGQADA